MIVIFAAPPLPVGIAGSGLSVQTQGGHSPLLVRKPQKEELDLVRTGFDRGETPRNGSLRYPFTLSPPTDLSRS